ncbi:MAG: AMP-binding protein, partial [Steroidobacterales bacterium]
MSDFRTMDELLRHVLGRARSQANHQALVESRAATTYGELAQRIVAVEAQLRRQGLVAGDPVLFAVRPGSAAITLLSGLILAGAIVVGVEPGVDPRILTQRLRLLPPRWVVAESLVYAAAKAGPLRWLLARRGIEFPPLHALGARLVRVGRRWPGVPPSISFAEMLAAPRVNADPPVPLAAERPILVLFTSGTTAAPKAAQHTARSLGACCSIVSDLLALTRNDVIYSTQSHMLLAGLLAGATCIVPGVRPDPRRFLRDLDRYRVTRSYAVPFDIAAVVPLLEDRRARLP